MNNLMQDLLYAFRSLAKARGFAAVAILTLAIALGANTAIFSVVSAILLQPLPVAEPQELVFVTGQTPRWETGPFSWPNYSDLKAQTKTLEYVAGYSGASSFLYSDGAEPERLRGSLVTHTLWPLLGVKPVLGRWFNAKEDTFGQPPIVMISYELWQRRFGGDPRIIGRQIRLGAQPKIVTGVMPRGFKFPFASTGKPDFWMSLGQDIEDAEGGGRGAIWIDVIGRMSNGVAVEQARAELKTIASRLEKQYPESNTRLTFNADRLHDVLVRDVRPALIVLLCAVGVVLLIGCANVANLLLARAAVRHKEISIRSALGATRGRIISQLLVESVLLSLLAGATGLLLAIWSVDLLVAMAPPEIPRVDAIAIDGTVLLFTLGLSVLTGIVFGVAPALSASKTNLVEALKEGSRGSTEGRRRNRVRNALVVSEIALSVILLVGAGLLLRSFLRLSGVDPGYDYRNAIAIEVSVRSAAFPEDAGMVQYQKRALAELAALPGVTAVGAASSLPLGNSENIFSFQIDGRPPFPLGQSPTAIFNTVTPGFFKAMGIPLLRGRPITDEDVPNGTRTMVVSESFVKKFFPTENPIGRTITVGDGNTQRTIVGVVGDTRFLSLLEAPQPAFYVANTQTVSRRLSFVVRAPNAAVLGPSLRAALRRLDREQPIIAIQTLEQMRSASLASRRFMLVLTGMLAALALVLAAVGIYSIMSYMVTQRTSEIGIRMSLGAEARDIFRLVVGQALKMVVIGLLGGIAIAIAGTRVMTSLLYGVTATDPVTFGSICVLIGVIALIASYIPAHRAARVDPLVAIRYD